MKVRWRQYEITFVSFAAFFFLLHFVLSTIPLVQEDLSMMGYEDAGWRMIIRNFIHYRLLPAAGPLFIVYVLYLLLNLLVIPHIIIHPKKVFLTIFITVGIWLLLLFIFAFTYYRPAFSNFLRYSSTVINISEMPLGIYASSFLLLFYTGYVIVREAVIKFVQGHTFRTILCNNITGVGFIYLSLLLVFYLLNLFRNDGFGVLYVFFILPAIIICFINVYWLFPLRQRMDWPLQQFIWRLLVAPLIFALLFGFVYNKGSLGAALIMFFCQTLIALPVSWFLFMQQKDRLSSLLHLQKDLGNTAANLQFLRSQINPHFLFNALNTIYGTALQENAERTSEAVQKLGDMMRFMLEENQQDRISLDKEITYLTNYINLQKLRTQVSPDIDITFSNKAQACHFQIAPMILIPFVENAFKHGISLKEKSWIRINISCDSKYIYFDVYNSVHEKTTGDPEKHRSGIGLENVKQRLSLIYPNQYELHIRAATSEYFVHLTLQP